MSDRRIRNPLPVVCLCAGLSSFLPAAGVQAQPPGPSTGLVRLGDFDAACSKDVIDERADAMCRQAISMALGKEPVVEEVARGEGGFTRTAKLMPADPAKARRLGEEACAHGRWQSCTLYTVLLDRGDGVPQDRARAEALTQYACSKGHALACESLHSRGIVPATDIALPARPGEMPAPSPEPAAVASANDPAVAMPLRKTQEQDEKPQLSSEQQLVPHQRPPQEQQHRAPAPAGGSSSTAEAAEANMITRCLAGTRDACHELARAYEHGTGVARDATRSAFYYEKACDIGHSAACGHIRRDAAGSWASRVFSGRVPLLIGICGLVAAGVFVSRRRGARQDAGAGPRPAPVRPAALARK